MVGRNPARSATLGSQPSCSRARLMSGWRWRGSSWGKGAWTSGELEPVNSRVRQQALAQVRAEKTGAAGNKDAFAQGVVHGFSIIDDAMPSAFLSKCPRTAGQRIVPSTVSHEFICLPCAGQPSHSAACGTCAGCSALLGHNCVVRWFTRRKGDDALRVRGLLGHQIVEHIINVVMKLAGILISECSCFCDNRILPHRQGSMSSRGVQMTGGS